MLLTFNFIFISSGIVIKRDKASALALSLPGLCSVVKVYSYKSIIHLIIFFEILVDCKTYERALLSVYKVKFTPCR